MNSVPSSKFAIILSFVAIIFGVVAIITTRPYNWEINAVGVAFATICALITFIAAWNIYSTLNADKKLKSFENDIESIKNETSEKLNNLERPIHSSMVEAFTGLSRFFAIEAAQKDGVEEMVFWYILCELTCVVHCSVIENFGECENRIKNITNTLKSKVCVQKGDKAKVHKLISMFSYADKISNFNDLLNSIENIQEQ